MCNLKFLICLISILSLSNGLKSYYFKKFKSSTNKKFSSIGDNNFNQLGLNSIENENEKLGYFSSVQLTKKLSTPESRKDFIENLVTNNEGIRHLN